MHCKNDMRSASASLFPRNPAVLFSALLAAAMFMAGCARKENAGAQTAPQAMPVQVQIVPSQTIPDTTEYLSVLKSRHSAVINPLVEGQITRILVKSGDKVSANAPLLQIDPLKQEAAVNSQEASRLAQESALKQAKINLERAQKLHEAGVISQSEFDNAQTSYDTAVAQLKSLEQMVQSQQVELHYYNVRAPFAGVVGDIPVHVGDRVAVTTLLTTVDEPGALEAYIYVPSSRLGDLRTGLPVKLLDETGAVRGESRIYFVSPQADTDTQTILAKAPVQNPKGSLRIGQQLRTLVEWGTRKGPVIPVLAVQRISGGYFAFVAVKEGASTVARQRPIRIGEIVGNDYAVLDGLNPGDHLIVSGLQFLQDGAPVAEQIKQADQSGPARSGNVQPSK